ncbi:MAG: hypothetical protein A3K59_05425 [Euryarchaeota archaeon RBG_19FT_COMBO_69_17]|nr:MAG: hypothetical protein A3K59_05425 [Euryarchaeota archaeon RBG_19FT_COMBO_69_17]
MSYYFGYPRLDPGFLGIITAFCVPTALVPGVVFILLGLRARRRERDLVEFAAWVKTYRRISLQNLGGKLGRSAFEAEKLLVEAVDRGFVKGFIDRTSEEFVLQEAVGEELFIESCPRCRGNIRQRYFRGETIVCPYCSAVIAQKQPTNPR